MNTAFGTSALNANNGGVSNTAVGYQALKACGDRARTKIRLSGISHSIITLVMVSDGYNTAIGSQAGKALTTGGYNTALGARALLNNTTGSQNTAIGLSTLTMGAENATALGYQAAFSGNSGTTTGSVYLGYKAAGGNALLTHSDYNTYPGVSSPVTSHTTGYDNIFIGAQVDNTSGGRLYNYGR
jgi:hypothetical protein